MRSSNRQIHDRTSFPQTGYSHRFCLSDTCAMMIGSLSVFLVLITNPTSLRVLSTRPFLQTTDTAHNLLSSSHVSHSLEDIKTVTTAGKRGCQTSLPVPHEYTIPFSRTTITHDGPHLTNLMFSSNRSGLKKVAF